MLRNKDNRTFRRLGWLGCFVISCSVEEEIVGDQIDLLVVVWSSVEGKRYVACTGPLLLLLKSRHRKQLTGAFFSSAACGNQASFDVYQETSSRESINT
jgi:hypothetical protein